MKVPIFTYICTLIMNLKTRMDMKKFIVTLMLAAACTCAFGQSIKDSMWDKDKDLNVQLGDSKWEMCPTMGITYNYSFNTPAGLDNSGLGLDLSLFELQWQGWKGGSITLGILDCIMDWQYLQKSFRFTPETSPVLIAGVNDGRSKGSRFDVSFGFPVGINQQFGRDFGISLIAVPGIGFYTYKNNYVANGVQHKDTLYPTSGRTSFHLHLKATIWYSNFGVVVRYQPLASKDMNTTILSVGIALRSK